MALSKEQREKMPASEFAVPELRVLPMHDSVHTRMAWNMLSRTKGLTDAQRSTARQRILKRAKEIGIDTSDWTASLTAALTFEAMSLDVPQVDDHPNRMPFHGVLTRLDTPSDNPVGGTRRNGVAHRTLIPKAVAEKALPSLLGMAVDFTPNLDGHDRTSKIGVITAANIVGDAIEIDGFFYAADFPAETALIQSEKDRLGFSYEAQGQIQDRDADLWVTEAMTFTGAAVLYKHLAAYTTTSLAAKAEKDFDMTPEELAAALATALKPVTDQITILAGKVEKVEQVTMEAAAMRDKVKPHSDALRACASNMEAAGIGMHETQGHVNVLRHMAASLEAEAVMGKMPHIYRDHDYLSRTMEAGAATLLEAQPDEATKKALETMTASLESLGTTVKDLQAKGFSQAQPPERRTLAPEITALLAKYDLSAAANDGKLTIEQVDKALAGLPVGQRLQQKMTLMASGVLPVAKAA